MLVLSLGRTLFVSQLADALIEPEQQHVLLLHDLVGGVAHGASGRRGDLRVEVADPHRADTRVEVLVAALDLRLRPCPLHFNNFITLTHIITRAKSTPQQ